MVLLIAFGGGILSGALTTELTIRILGHWAVLDVPNYRSSHESPTIRGGGIGLAAGTLVTLAIAHTYFVGASALALVIAGLVFGAIGFADDLTDALPVTIRLLLHVAAAAAVVVVEWPHATRGILLTALLAAASILWVVSFVNAFNFMDGINGISAAETVVAGAAFGLFGRHAHLQVLEVGALALVAGSIGFAPFNFPNARVFLGDVGSYFSGAWLAMLVLIGIHESIPAEAMIAPVALYVADTGVTLARRLRRHERWQQAHRQHTYQRLVDLGWSHTKTTGLVFAIVAVSAALGSVCIFGSVTERVGADFGVGALIVGYLLLPGWIESRYLLRARGGSISPID